MSDKKLRITLVRSPIGYTKRQKATVKALGLGRMHSSVVQPDTPPIRGMIYKVSHLVKVEEIEA
jgi:large subunit ribosomal protein L30